MNKQSTDRSNFRYSTLLSVKSLVKIILKTCSKYLGITYMIIYIHMVSEVVKVTKHALNHNIFVHLLLRIFLEYVGKSETNIFLI